MRISRHLTILGMTLIVGCDGANFAGVGGKKDTPGRDPGTDDGNPKDSALLWNWNCQDSTSKNVVKDKVIELYGPGPHKLTRESVHGAQLHLKGDACGANSADRDAVFVIDVSGSMYNPSPGIFGSAGNDPMVGGTCNRMKALDAVIATIKSKSPNSRFGVVTFSTAVNQASTQLYSEKAELFADLLGQSSFSSIEQLICHGEGDTNYDSGLTQARDILDAEQMENHVREVYFISDGKPDPADKNGRAIADEMHANTTIATVMVGGADDSILKNYVASKDQFNLPLHARAEHSSQLAEILSKLANNTVVGAELEYGDTANPDGQLDFTDQLNGSSFDFDAFVINTDSLPNGLTVKFTYKDRFGDSKSVTGEIQWVDAE